MASLLPRLYTPSDKIDYTKAAMAYISKTDNQLLEIEDFLQEQINKSVDQVATDGSMVKGVNIDALGRLNSYIYNDLMDFIAIDMSVMYDRLNSMVAIVNQTKRTTSSLVNSLLTRTNNMLSRIRAQNTLHDLQNEYDSIIVNTFNQDNNTMEDRTFAATLNSKAGLISLGTISQDNIIENELNYDLYVERLNDNVTIRMISDKVAQSSDDLGGGLTIRGISDRPAKISDLNLGVEQSGSSYINSSVTFDGASVAIIFDLPDSKLINSISMATFGSGPLDVLGVYYAKTRVIKTESMKWIKIAADIDTSNINGTALKFEGIEATSLMVVVGQQYYTKKIMAVQQYHMERDRMDIRTLTKNLKKIDINNSGNLIKSYIPASIRGFLSAAVQKVIGGLLGMIQKMVPKTFSTKTTTVYEYIFNISELNVQYTHNQGASTFKSPYYGNKGATEAVTLAANDYMPSGTYVTYELETAGGRARLIPQEHATDAIVDVRIIDDITDRSFNTDFTFDALNPPTVKINDQIVSATVIKPFDASTIGVGITLAASVTVGANDLLTIEYYPSSVTLLGDEHNVTEMAFENILGDPTYTHQELKCKKTRMTLEPLSGTYITYDMPSDGNYALLPTSPQRQLAEYGFKVMTHKGYLPSGAEELVGGGWGVDDEYVLGPQSFLYHGIFDERHFVAGSGDAMLYTDFPYKPGTLNVFTFNQDTDERVHIKVIEYDTDLSGAIQDKTAFTSADGTLAGFLYCSYNPLSGGIVESNIAKPNQSEYFTHTTEDGYVDLDFSPYVDNNIMYDSLLPVPIWTYATGTFIYNEIPEIKYDPIEVLIKGYKARNRTDYIAGKIPILNEYTPTRKNFEYYTVGNRVFFNAKLTIPMTINYYARPDWFRLIATLRRTNLKDDTITPVVYDYSLLVDERET